MQLPNSPDVRPLGPGPAAGVALLLALLSCWPIWVTGKVYVFADTQSYLRAGAFIASVVAETLAGMFSTPEIAATPGAGGDVGAAAREVRIVGAGNDGNGATGRSVTYSALFFLLHSTLGSAAMAVAQTWAVAFVALALVPRAAILERPAVFTLAAVALAAVTTLPWYAVFLMPDILAAVPILFGMLLVGRIDMLGAPHLTAIAGVSAFAVSAHYGVIPLAFGVVGVALCVRLLAGLRLGPGVLLSALVVVAAAPLLNIAASTAVLKSPSVAPLRLPILLARSIEDGPARWYLAEACPTADLAICEVFDSGMPDNVGAVLWSSEGIADATPEQMARIRAEEWQVLTRAFLEYPVEQMASLGGNAVAQMGLISLDSIKAADGIGPDYQSLKDDREAGARPLVRRFEPIASWGTLTLSLALGLAALTRLNQPIVLRMLLIAAAGLVVNAAVFGGLSAPSARYQSRLIWLLPFAFMLALAEARVLVRQPRRLRS